MSSLEEQNEGDLYELKNDSIDILTQNSMYDPNKSTPANSVQPNLVNAMASDAPNSIAFE